MADDYAANIVAALVPCNAHSAFSSALCPRCVALASLGQLEQEAARVPTLKAALRECAEILLLDVRRAAFALEIGTRMTEAYRLDIADACRRAEDRLHAASNDTKQP